MSNSILIDMADLLLQAEQRSRDDESDSDEEIAGTAEASSDINQRRNSTRRSDIFIAPASSRAIPSAPRPSLDDSTSNSLAAWREPRQHLRDRDLLSSEFQYEIDLPSLREGEEDNATGQKSGKGVRKMQNSPCLAGLLPACISQSKASSSAASWRRGSDDLESSLPPGEDVDNVPDDRLLPSVRDAEFVRMAVCLLAASFNFSLDIVLMALLWTSLIIPGAAVATFLIFLPPFLGGIALFLAIRKGWGQGLFNDPLLSLLPFAIVILDAITLVMLPSIYFSTSGLNKSCK